MENIHYYIYIYCDISESFDHFVFRCQLSEDFVKMLQHQQAVYYGNWESLVYQNTKIFAMEFLIGQKWRH